MEAYSFKEKTRRLFRYRKLNENQETKLQTQFTTVTIQSQIETTNIAEILNKNWFYLCCGNNWF